jgi:4-hydroxybenzoate polyprenyltransferase
MEKMHQYLKSVPITFESWVASVVGIILIRTFFEQFSSFQAGRFALIDPQTIIHYSIFYITTVISLSIILYIFAQTDTREVFTLATLGIPIILLPPIIDLAYAGIGGHWMSYLFVPASELFTRFLTFWGGHIDNGITLGIQVETFLGMVFCFTYVYLSRKDVWRAIGAGITFYLVLFLFASVPSLFALIGPEANSTSNTIVQQIFSSRIVTDNLHPSFGASELALFDLGFNKLMTGIFTIIAILLVQLFFFLSAREKFIAVIKNSRPERIFHFFLLFLFGTALVHGTWFHNWIDVMTYLLTFAAFKCAWIFSVCQNDIYDKNIDNVSNKDRPLVANVLSRSDLELVSRISLFFGFLCAYSASRYALFFVTFYTLVYFIYSNPPFRLKRFVLVNSFLVSLACLSVIMAGFFAVSTDKSILTFPPSLVLALIIFFTAVTNIRDIKDIDGDRADGIKTLPVLLGLKKAKMLVAGTICFFFLLIPTYFNIPYLYIPAIVASSLLWYFTNKKNYIEWKGFVVYMLYLIFIISVLIMK